MVFRIFLFIAWASSPALVLPRSDQTTSQWWWKGGPGEDSEEEITVFVPIPDDVQAKDVTVDIRRSHLSVRVKDQLPLEGQLWKDIRADESGWLIDKEDYDYLLQSDADAAKEKMKGLPET